MTRAAGAWWRASAPWALSVALHAGVVGAVTLAHLPPGARAPEAPVSFGSVSHVVVGSFDAHGADDFAPMEGVGAGAPSPDFSSFAPASHEPDDAFEGYGAPLLAPRAAPGPAPVERAPVVSIESAAPSRVDLFGLRGEQGAQRIAFVVDASGSMLAAMPVVRREIRRSLERLDESQRFQVVYFKRGEYRTPEGLAGERDGALIRATEANKRAVSAWLETVNAEGGSDPLPALERTLRLRPDLVFLVSKGVVDPSLDEQAMREFTRRTLDTLDRLNPRDARNGLRPATIKVVHFYDDDPSGLLRMIGERHGGEDGYVFVRRGERWAE